MNLSTLMPRVKRHEGFRGVPYQDAGGWAVGFGCNLSQDPLTEGEGEHLLLNRLLRAKQAAVRVFPFYDALDPERQNVLVEMTYQMGEGGISKFKKFLAALTGGNWKEAHDEMLDSKWARDDSPVRAQELAAIMLTGEST